MRPERLLVAILASAAALTQADAVAGAAPEPGLTWDSIASLPDFGGSWSLKLQPVPQPRFKPKPAALLNDWVRKTHDGEDPADVDGMKRTYCGPARFSGFNGGLQDYVEFLFTPGHVTIINELGLIRRITLGNEAFPEEVPETNTGVSIGRWEGRTLVVETRGLSRDIGFDEPRTRLPVKIGRNVRIIERFSLKEPDVLQVATRMVAPDVLAAPYEVTALYTRDRRHAFQEITNCVQNDRAFDDRSGRERFDLTPPTDLPPPPSR